MSDEIKKTKNDVTFTPEQMEKIQELIMGSKNEKDVNSGRQAISRFSNTRDPKEIVTCPIYRFDGKFVIGFKDYNKDPYRKQPRFYDLKLDLNRKLADQPFVTLLLSNDGKEIEEKEVPVVDYTRQRMKVGIEKPNFKIVEKQRLEDHGIIAPGGGGTFAQEMTSTGQFVQPTLVKSESKHIDRTFIINLPGFDKPVEMIEEFLA